MPSANAQLVALCKMMGGRRATVEAINEARSVAGDPLGEVTLRQLLNWIYEERLPAIAYFYLLLAASHRNVPLKSACEAFPDLLPTARMVANMTRRPVARAAE